MDKDVKQFLDFLQSNECNIWELNGCLESKKEHATLTKIFTDEQLIILQAIVKHIISSYEWHNEEDEESHEDIRGQLKKMDARLRNHRHDYSKTFTAKAEY